MMIFHRRPYYCFPWSGVGVGVRGFIRGRHSARHTPYASHRRHLCSKANEISNKSGARRASCSNKAHSPASPTKSKQSKTPTPLFPSRCESARVLMPSMEDHKQRVRNHKGENAKVPKAASSLQRAMTPEERAHVSAFYATERLRNAKQEKEERQNSERKGVGGGSSLKRKSLKEISGMVETKIQEGVWNGAFSNLKGQGKPLSHLDEDICSRLLRRNNCRPVWIDQMHELKHEREVILSQVKGIAYLDAFQDQSDFDVRRSALALGELKKRASEYNAKVKDWNLIRPIPHLWLSSVNVMKELKDREKSLDMESIRDVFGADANRETIIRHILQYKKNNQNNNWKTTGSSSGHGSHDMIYSVISKLIFKEQQQQDQAAKKPQSSSSSSSSSSSCSKPPLLSSVQHVSHKSRTS